MKKIVAQVLPLLALCLGSVPPAEAQVEDASLTIDGVQTMLPLTTNPYGFTIGGVNGGAYQVTGLNGDVANITANAVHSSDNVWSISYTLDWQNPNAPGTVTLALRAPVQDPTALRLGPTEVSSDFYGTATTTNPSNYLDTNTVSSYPDDPTIALPAGAGALQRSFLGTGSTVYDTGLDAGASQSFPTADSYNFGIIGPIGPVPDPVGSPRYDYLMLVTSFTTGGNGISVDMNGSASETYVPEPNAFALTGAAALSLIAAGWRQARRKRSGRA